MFLWRSLEVLEKERRKNRFFLLPPSLTLAPPWYQIISSYAKGHIDHEAQLRCLTTHASQIRCPLA